MKSGRDDLEGVGAETGATRPGDSSTGASSRATRRLGVGGLGVLFVIAYWRAVGGGPVFDDFDHLTRPELRDWGGLWRIWSEPGVVSQYYPVTHSLFWAQARLWGDAMPGYHLVNLALHGLCAVLFWSVLRRLAVPGAIWASGVFLLHPVMVESVAWISEQKNTLSTALYLGAALACIRFDATRSRRAWAAGLALFAAAVLAKAPASTLPAALLVVIWWKRGRIDARRDVVPLLPFFVVAAAAGSFAVWMEKHFIGASGGDYALGMVERALVAGRAVWFYLGKLFWPAELVFIYPRWTPDTADLGWYAAPVAALLALAGAWLLRRRTRAPFAGLLLFGGTLFPALGFVDVYPFRYSFVADHYQYLAALGPVALATAGMATWAAKGARARSVGSMAAGVVVLLGLTALSWRQSGFYRDGETLWTETVRRNPQAYVAHGNLGYLHLLAGRWEESKQASERAIKLRPDYADALSNFGTAQRQLGDTEGAILSFRRALALEPGLAAAHLNLALALREAGGADGAGDAAGAGEREAEIGEHLREAVRLRPNLADARVALGDWLMTKGEAGEARRHYEAAITTRPDHGGARYNLGVLSEREGEVEAAAGHYQAALAAEPELAEAGNNLALIRLRQGRTEEAIALAGAAVKNRPAYLEARYNLALALARAGRRAEASGELETLLRLRADFAPARDLLRRLGGVRSERDAGNGVVATGE